MAHDNLCNQSQEGLLLCSQDRPCHDIKDKKTTNVDPILSCQRSSSIVPKERWASNEWQLIEPCVLGKISDDEAGESTRNRFKFECFLWDFSYNFSCEIQHPRHTSHSLPSFRTLEQPIHSPSPFTSHFLLSAISRDLVDSARKYWCSLSSTLYLVSSMNFSTETRLYLTMALWAFNRIAVNCASAVRVLSGEVAPSAETVSSSGRTAKLRCLVFFSFREVG